MASKQDKALTEKMKRLGYSKFEAKPGQEDVIMLHVEGHFICSVAYALEMSDEQLKALIEETLEVK